MNKKLTRQNKEQLYIKKMTELQIRWKNPIDSDWDFSDWSDEQLDKGLENTIGQLRFEKVWDAFGNTVKYIIWAFVVLGIMGLLLFGLRQLF